MADSHETRVLDLIVTYLNNTPGVTFAAKGGPLDFTQQAGLLPAAIVLPDFPGARRLASSRNVSVDWPFAVEGHVRSRVDLLEKRAFTDAMQFRQIIENAILSDGLKLTLTDDFLAHNGGCDGLIRPSSEHSEEDWAPPFARFRRHYIAVLHYIEGAL